MLTPDSIKKIIISGSEEEQYKARQNDLHPDRLIDKWLYNGKKETRLHKAIARRGIENYELQEAMLYITSMDAIKGSIVNEDEILEKYKIIQDRWIMQKKQCKTADTIYDVYIPKDLDDAIKQMDSEWHDTLKDKFRKFEEGEFSARLHLGYGTSLRNRWQLWSGCSRLYLYFYDKGVNHPEDISGIIIKYFYRHLKDIPVTVEELIEENNAYYRKRDSITLEDRKKELLDYNINDTVELGYEYENIGFPLTWKRGKKCETIGIIKEKNADSLTINVQMIKCCMKKGIVYAEEKIKNVKKQKKQYTYMREGDTKWFYFKYWELY